MIYKNQQKIEDILAMNNNQDFFDWLYQEYRIPEWQYHLMQLVTRKHYYDKYTNTKGSESND